MKSVANIGIDVGNYDTKSALTTTPSGLGSYSAPPFGADEVLEYNGVYYVPDIARFAYVKDKTKDENAFILTLFGIAKEIIARVSRGGRSKEEIQSEIDKIAYINLGVGLPPTHMSKQTNSLNEYYHTRFHYGEGRGIEFKFNNYSFNIALNALRIWPQDAAAVMTYRPRNENFISNKHKTYYAIDIGGYTVDVVPMINGKLDVKRCDSKELGILKLFDEITITVEREYGISLNAERIDSVLRGEESILSPEIIDVITSSAAHWLDSILNQLRQNGLEFAAYPVIFIGGGAQLLKPYIKKNPLLTMYAFIPSPRANAEGYQKLIELELKATLSKTNGK